MSDNKNRRHVIARAGLFLAVATALVTVVPLLSELVSATAEESGFTPKLSRSQMAPASTVATETAPTDPAPVAEPEPGPIPADTTAPSPDAEAEQKPSIDAYRGLGSWVDVWDERAYRNPKATVADMAENGVSTIFIETGNSKTPSAVMHPKELSVFIEEAHARKMYVVGWYLPHYKSVARDAARIKKGIDFTTPNGQRFDSFAIDIESLAVKKVSVRNRRVKALTTRVQGMVGDDYPLGAIIPSPLDSAGGYWRQIPYAFIAKNYDVIMPMSYYTFRVDGPSEVRSRTIADVKRLRSRPGCSAIPIHMIGGLAEKSSGGETRAFVDALHDTNVIGGSMYSWTGTRTSDWKQLRSLAR